MYCYSSINLSQLLAAWAQRLPTLLKLAIGLAGYRVGWLSGWLAIGTHAHTKRFLICATETPREWWGRILAFHEPNEPHPLRDEYDTIIKPFLLQAISAGHGVVSTSGCAGPVSQPLVTGTYQSVAHLDQVLSMQCAWWWWWLVWELPCRLVLFFPSSVVD